MKVLCVSDQNCRDPKPLIGEQYTVRATHELAANQMGCNHPGGLYYELQEVSFCYYYYLLFIPLSDLDETKMERNYTHKTQTV